MENLFVYLIITVILILASLRGNKKTQQAKSGKTAPGSTGTPQPSMQKNISLEKFFQSLESDIFDEEDEFVLQKNQPKNPSKNQQTTSKSPFLDYELKHTRQSKNPNQKREKNYSSEEFALLMDETSENESVEHSEIAIQLRDELRKAIIYSEIFNRKYV